MVYTRYIITKYVLVVIYKSYNKLECLSLTDVSCLRVWMWLKVVLKIIVCILYLYMYIECFVPTDINSLILWLPLKLVTMLRISFVRNFQLMY